ncbi:hypothetical protein BJX66DRAFT_279784 [Aspergillus keveii]|uniref:Uncharacterized protein n=1 Tax=Aspergillus keveii TaxID=714993 RepID=A0ABR4FXR4_9EURO
MCPAAALNAFMLLSQPILQCIPCQEEALINSTPRRVVMRRGQSIWSAPLPHNTANLEPENHIRASLSLVLSVCPIRYQPSGVFQLASIYAKREQKERYDERKKVEELPQAE